MYLRQNGFRDKYNNESTYRETKENYYQKKDFLLKTVEPSQIHYDSELDTYYLFYDFDKFSFHSPINNPQDYQNLETITLTKLRTQGKEVTDLLSVQFADKIYDLIKSGDYEFIN